MLVCAHDTKTLQGQCLSISTHQVVSNCVLVLSNCVFRLNTKQIFNLVLPHNTTLTAGSFLFVNTLRFKVGGVWRFFLFLKFTTHNVVNFTAFLRNCM